MGDDLRFLGIVAQKGQKIAAEAHWLLFGVGSGFENPRPFSNEPCLAWKAEKSPTGPLARLIARIARLSNQPLSIRAAPGESLFRNAPLA